MKVSLLSVGFQSINYKTNVFNSKNDQINFKAKGVYPGSFDPITNGHIDIIKRASSLFDTLTVLVAKNPEKKGFLPIEQRIMLIKQAVKDLCLKNVQVTSTPDLTTSFAKSTDTRFMVRGLRDTQDFQGEMSLFNINAKIAPQIDTIFLPTKPENSIVSSSTVRSIFNLGGDISNFVPKCVADFMRTLK